MRAGHAFQRACRPRTGKHAAGADTVMTGEHAPVMRDEGDINRTVHG